MRLDDGSTVTADEDYLRESIVRPNAKKVAGYQPVMPSYEGQIGEEGILQIVAYLKSRRAPAVAQPSTTKPSTAQPATTPPKK